MVNEKRSFANIDYLILLPLISQRIAGKWFSKIQKIQENVYRLKFGSENLIVWLSKAVFLSSKKEFNSIEDSFCKNLSKTLYNEKLQSAYLFDNDRIFILEFRKKKLIFEMFGKGNIILIDSETGIIINCLKEESWSSREIKKGKKYTKPPSLSFPQSITEFKKYLISRENEYLVVSLSKLPIGINYVKKLLTLLSIDEKLSASKLSDSNIELLYKRISELRQKKPVGYAIYDGNLIIDFFLADLGEGSVYGDPLALVEDYYSICLAPNEKTDSSNQYYELQKKALQQKAEQNLAIAKEIENNINELEKIIEMVKNGEKSGESENYIFQMNYSEKLLKVIKKKN